MLSPRDDRILVKPIARVASTIIEVMLAEKPNVGEIIAVGPGKRNKLGIRIPLEVKPGNLIRFGEFQFPEYHEDGVKYLILQEADVAGILESSVCD